MNVRILIIIALAIAALAGWFFYNQGATPPVVNIKPAEVDYEATDIKAVQTNDNGDTEYELNADSLKHNPQTNEDEIAGLNMNWEPGSEQRYQIKAGAAAINQQTGDMRLSNGFVLSSKGNNAGPDGSADKSVDKTTPIIIKGSTLQGNTKARKVYSNEPVQVIQGDNRFEAASMTADLEAGEYEFGQVAVTFMPPDRKDEKLF